MNVDEVDTKLLATNRRRLAALTLHYALKPVGHIELSDVYRFDLRSLPPDRELSDYEIAPATSADIEDICINLKRDEPAFVIQNLWLGGHLCFVARRDGRVLAYNWVAFSAVQEEEYRIELLPADVFCLNAYTHPDHRGRGIHYKLLRTLLECAAARGKTDAYTLVSLFNRDSWKSHIRMGWKRSFTYCYFRPYFVPGRLPWPLTAPRYPARLDWARHSWLQRTTDKIER